MNSVFSLATDVKQLAMGNQGLSNMQYNQISSTRNCAEAAFPDGPIQFKFDVGGGKWFVPQRSYLRMRLKISRGDGTSLLESDNIAPSLNMMSNLFQSAEFKMNGTTISRVTDFMSAVSTLKYRLDKSSSWLDTIGNSTNFWDNHASRKADVCADGLFSDETFVTSWTNLGFDVTDQIIYTHATKSIEFEDNAGAPVALDVRTKFPIGSRIRLLGVHQTLTDPIVIVLAHTNANTLEVESALAVDIPMQNIQLERVTTGTSSVSRVNARKISHVEIIWSPPLSIFDFQSGISGSCEMELILTPQSSNTYQLLAIESTGAGKTTGNAVTDFKVSVENLFFYTNIINGPRVENMNYLIDLEQISCQASVVNNANFAQHNFTVPPSTYAFTVAIQDGRVGADTRCSGSRFKSYNRTLTGGDEELKLTRLHVSYAGNNYPSPDAEPNFIDGTDFTVNRYVDSNIYSGAYFGMGGCESIEQFHERGSYYYFACPKDDDDASTRVVVNAGFQIGTDTTNMRILLFAHSRQCASVSMIDGKCQSVNVQDV
jgi:hypothetical protein